jgi:APA family basic amino acid/polyamine antiporter
MVAAATGALGFAGYLRSFLDIPAPFVAILLILFLSILNFAGIEESSRLNIIFTLVEVSGLVLIIGLGVFSGNILKTNYLEAPSIAGVFGCAALTLFAYLGFEDVVHISEEIEHPTRNVPRALFLSLVISTILYVLVSIAAVALVSWRELGASEAPLALAASQVLGKDASTVLTLIALFATANTVLILLLVSSRIMYGMAVDRSLPKAFARIHGKTGTPVFSIITVMALSILFAFLGDIRVVANVTNFVTFAVFSSVNLSCILLRHAQPGLERPFRTPLNMGKHSLIPFIGLISCGFLITQLDQPSILLGILILIMGGAVYKLLKRGESRDPI